MKIAALATLSLLALAGCASGPPAKLTYPTAFDYPAEYAMQSPTAPQVPVAPAPQAVTAGAIYREGSGGLALFQDQKARQPGDLLTISLVETTTATSSASTTTTKDSSTELEVGALFGAPVTLGGRDIGSTEASGERAFTGSGTSAQSNSLRGNVTVTVVQRLANGNLLVRGDKVLRLNQSDEVVQIMGIVRTADIGPDNTVASSRVADVRIVYGGKGAIAKSNVMGWLSRFFQSPYFPM